MNLSNAQNNAQNNGSVQNNNAQPQPLIPVPPSFPESLPPPTVAQTTPFDSAQLNSAPSEAVLPNLWQQIQEDWVAHGRDWTKPGFRAVAVYRFGVWRMTVQPKLLRAPLSLLYGMLYRKMRNGYGIELPYTTKLGRRVVIEHQGGIVIHGFCEIGDDCIIRQGVTLGNRYLDRPFEAPKLGKRVNVGAGAKVLGGVIIEEDATIGANAVVLANVPAGQTAVGIPAKLLKPRA